MATIIKDAKVLGNMISDLGKSLKTIDKTIQQLSLSCIAHVECGNPVLANRLLTAVNKGAQSKARVSAVQAHMTAYGMVKFDKKTNKLVFAKTKKTDLQGAKDNPWWLEKETTFKPTGYDLGKLLNSKFNSILDDIASGNATVEQAKILEDGLQAVKDDAKKLNIVLVIKES